MDRRYRKPFDLFDKPDYTTNAESYYDELAKNKKLLKKLVERIWEYDKELAKRFEAWDKNLEELPDDVMKLLEKWVLDGSFEHLLNTTLLNNKADIVTSIEEPTFSNDKTYWYKITDTLESSLPTLDGDIGYDEI